MHFDVSFHVSDMALPADFGKVQTASDGGYERGYADGYGKGETVARIEAEAHNAEILTDCNAVLPTKGVETADTLEQVPQRIGKIQSYSEGYNAGYAEGVEVGSIDILKNINGLYFFFANGQNMGLLPYVLKSDVSHIENWQYAFQNNAALTEFVAPESMNTTAPHYMFQGCKNLVRVSGLDHGITGPVLTGLFENCTSLVDAGIINFKGVTYARSTFEGCTALEEIRIVGTINLSVSFANSALLSDLSTQSVIGGLADLTGQAAKTLTLHATVGNKLTAAQKATITAKNWALVY